MTIVASTGMLLVAARRRYSIGKNEPESTALWQIEAARLSAHDCSVLALETKTTPNSSETRR